MKKLVFLLVAAALTFGTVSSALAEAEVSGGAYVGVFDKYLWRGADLSGSKPVAQGGVDLSVGGFTVSYWSNFQLSNYALGTDDELRSGELNETDITLDYTFDANDLLSVSVGNILYAVDGAEDTNELYLGISLNTLLSPSLTVYYDWDEFSGTIFTVAAIGHEFALADKLALNLGASASYYMADSDFVLAYAPTDAATGNPTHTGSQNFLHNAEFSASVNYALSEQLSISPSVLFSVPLSDDAEDIVGIDDEIMSGLSLVFSF